MVGGTIAERFEAGARVWRGGRLLPPVVTCSLLIILLLFIPAAQAERDLLSQAEWATTQDRLSPAEAMTLDYRAVEAAALNLGPYQGQFWLRIRLDGDSVGESRWLSILWPYFRDLRVFLRESNAPDADWLEVRETTEMTGLLDMPGHPGRLLPRFSGEREVLVQLRADGPTALRLTLGTLEEERERTLMRYTLFGVYLGAMLGMAAFSLFLMLAVREPTYLGFAAFLTATVLYIGLRYNVLAPWLPEVMQALPPASRVQLAVALVGLSGIWFVRRFLRTPRDDRPADIALVGIMVAALLSMPASIWMGGVFSFGMVAVFAVATLLTVASVAYRAMRRGFEPAAYLMLGWLVFSLAVLMYLAMLLGWLPYAGWLTAALPVGSLASALLLALALGSRIRHKQREEAALARERDQYRFLSEQDGLTGLYNRRALDRRLDHAIATSLRTGDPLSLIVLDTDWFKDYNDRYGHLAGDDALRCLARVMQANVRDGDACFRYGGEEFVVILPGQALAQAAGVAERIREAYRVNSASELGSGCTVSLGVAQFQEGDTANTLLARGDAALYRAKECGRDRLELAR